MCLAAGWCWAFGLYRLATRSSRRRVYRYRLGRAPSYRTLKQRKESIPQRAEPRERAIAARHGDLVRSFIPTRGGRLTVYLPRRCEQQLAANYSSVPKSLETTKLCSPGHALHRALVAHAACGVAVVEAVALDQDVDVAGESRCGGIGVAGRRRGVDDGLIDAAGRSGGSTIGADVLFWNEVASGHGAVGADSAGLSLGLSVLRRPNDRVVWCGVAATARWIALDTAGHLVSAGIGVPAAAATILVNTSFTPTSGIARSSLGGGM